jgi:hypothetical protein
MSLIIIDKNKLDKLISQLTVKLVILSMRTRTAKERLNTILDNLEPALETLAEIKELDLSVVDCNGGIDNQSLQVIIMNYNELLDSIHTSGIAPKLSLHIPQFQIFESLNKAKERAEQLSKE